MFIEKYNTVGAWDLISVPVVVNSENDISYPQIAVYTTSVVDDGTGDDSGGGEAPTGYQGVYFGTKKITNVYFGEKDITKLMFGNLTVIE